MSILEDLAGRFDNKGDFIQSIAFLSKQEYAQLLTLFKGSTDALNELIMFVIETLTYKLGVKFDNMKLGREAYPYLNKETNEREMIYPLVLTLFNRGQKVLIMEGGETKVVTQDLILLFDKLLTMNMIHSSSKPMVDFSLLVNVGIEC